MGTVGEAGQVPKQLRRIGGIRVLEHSVRAVAAVSEAVIVVAPDGFVEDHRSEHADLVTVVVPGGSTRSASVKAGLDALAHLHPSHVLIHDAARPAVPPEVVERVRDALDSGAQAVVPVVPVTDSLRSVGGEPVDRTQFVGVQTPQGFDFGVIMAAYRAGGDATDDATLVSAMGGTVTTVPGDPKNIKVTVAPDLAVAGILMGMQPSAEFGRLRTGQGFDVHRWSADPHRQLVLGGVVFPDASGLRGHSDADVIAHSVIDAMLSAAGMGDIGVMFPDTDPRFEGASSIELLRLAAERLRMAGWTIINADCTVVLDAPKISAEREAMEINLSEAAGGPVTIKGKRTEGVTALAEGVQCFATVLMVGP
ncbi:MAG: 2-C-methyl-D-erythritol 2,4-cyclodiphosphate synthase [Acidimicrobiales bacterium]|nr:2-C-methyl-D-erythritol 2,4-cyclodiphosphate synthase [Acidimicrobiales bacterium]